MGETEQRPTAGSRLGAQENAGISTLEHGQKPPMTPPGKLVSIKIQMLDDTQETFDIPVRMWRLWGAKDYLGISDNAYSQTTSLFISAVFFG